MNNNEKPIVVVSKCLGFEPCRYNGQMSNDNFISELKEYVNFITVCPEVQIGLSIPRDAIRIVKKGDSNKLVQPNTDLDLTKLMCEFSNEFLEELEVVDGFILKSRSPSCGIKDVKIYNSCDKGSSFNKGKGVFGNAVLNTHPWLAIEDDGRLKDFSIREHFLTKLFTITKFRKIKETKSIDKLKEFNLSNNLLFMSYNNKRKKELDKIMNNINDKDIFSQYEKYLGLIFSKAARYTSKINVLNMCMERFIDKLKDDEKQFIHRSIDDYVEGHISFSVPLYLVKSYALRFEIDDLLKQTFFEPYPSELVSMRDSGKVV